MRRKLLCILLFVLLPLATWATHRRWTVTDGLPTGEVQQIVELPNRQMLINCEGVFCLSNGAGFDVVACDYGRSYQLSPFAKGYGRMWQGDSLLWLHDFYRIYLFDARRMAFRYDISQRLSKDFLQRFLGGELMRDVPDGRQWRCIDSLGLAKDYGTMTQDRQGGLWIGTRNQGIVYVSPLKEKVVTLPDGHQLTDIARSYTDRQGRLWRCKADGLECEEQGRSVFYNKNLVKGLPYNRTTFIEQLPDGRYLLCDSLSTLGYFLPAKRLFVPLNGKISRLQGYRHLVGACTLDRKWTVVYAQNGCFMLDVEADTLASFPPAGEIERYASKYNCMLLDGERRLWVGTQNGLYVATWRKLGQGGQDTWTVSRVDGLRNNCIRSLTSDARGRVWAGTSAGVSRVTPTVVNLGTEDGIPLAAMMERAACMAADGRLVFALGGSTAISFSPDSVVTVGKPLSVVITAFRANGAAVLQDDLPLAHVQNNLTFSFSTLDYAAPSHSLYRYRLWPAEEEWNVSNDGSGQCSARYMALPPGHYRFEVQASAASGQWGEATVVEFDIRPPFWLTWWAKMLYAVLCLLVGGLLVHLYLKKRRQQLERANDERVNRLFELRDEAGHQFAQSASIVPEKISADKEEEALVEKLLKAIGQNMDNTDYTVDQLASDVAMSRASLYKKTQQMLGITPNEFLRNVRLKHAARLLAETGEPVNQISLMVGFQTPRYFSQCFRQMFGVTPSEYRSGNAVETAAGTSHPEK